MTNLTPQSILADFRRLADELARDGDEYTAQEIQDLVKQLEALLP